MKKIHFTIRNQTLIILWVGIISTVLIIQLAHATSTSTSTGSIELSITAPKSLPAGFVLNPGGTSPSNFSFPNSGNSGTGTFTGMGMANCSPNGCTSPDPDINLQYQLATNLTCHAETIGNYGGLEDSFALFGGRNMTGGSVILSLRFTSSWSISSIVDNPPISDTADASIDILWAVPTDFCIELSSCPTGFLSGGVSGNCPSGFVEGSTLVLGSGILDSSMGSLMETAPKSICDVSVIVLDNASSGGDLSVTSSCTANSNDIIFTNGFEPDG